RAAIDDGLDHDPELAKQLEDLKSNLMMQAYERRLVDGLAKPTDAQLEDYYNKHLKEFTMPARLNASWIRCNTPADAQEARRRIVERGENFGKVAQQVSVDKTTAQDGGLLGYFNPTGYVRGIPPEKRQEFVDKAFALEAADVSPVFEFDGAFCFVKVHEK